MERSIHPDPSGSTSMREPTRSNMAADYKNGDVPKGQNTFKMFWLFFYLYYLYNVIELHHIFHKTIIYQSSVEKLMENNGFTR